LFIQVQWFMFWEVVKSMLNCVNSSNSISKNILW
jgi:hypothetical protein